MTPEQDPPRDRELEQALELVARPTARPEFRAALRERFLAGAVESGPSASSAVRREPASVPGAEPRGAESRRDELHTAELHAVESLRTDRRPRRGRLVLLAAALATAAAVVLTVFLNRPRPAVWTVLDGTSATSVVVDGRTLDAADRPALAAALLSAREVEVRGGALRVRVRDEALLELAAGTRLSQMQFAAAGPYQLRTDHGSLAVATTPAFGQRGLRILTEDFAVAVTGTRFSVDVDAHGSCVCCLEGTLACTPATTKTPTPISAGQMCFSSRDRSPPHFGAAFAEHLRPVERLPE